MEEKVLTPHEKKLRRRALVGSITGSTIEWYDFLLYGTIAPIVFAPQFFPETSQFVSIMLAYLGNALTFFIRPFGGIFFAHIGDRIGRKKTLIVTLSMMGGGTMLIGFLPNYHQIGLWAPALLFACRIIQGLAIGGEWGGALLLAYEYAPNKRKGLYGAIPQTGVTWGLILGNVAFLIALYLGGDAFETWVWRVPFIASFILIFIGLWIRKELEETPEFQAVKDAGLVEKNPLGATLRENWKEVLIAIAVKAVETAPFYVFVIYMVGYAIRVLKYPKSELLLAILIAALVSSLFIPVCGLLSDYFGRVRVYVFGVIFLTAATYPYFMMIQTGSFVVMLIATIIVLGFAWSFITATLGTMMSELFSANVRYTGITLGYQIGAAIFSGTAPMVCVYLVEKADDQWWPIPLYIAGLAVLSLVGIVAAFYRGRRLRKDTHETAQ
ncbi:MAG: MFS transporter [Actinomycetaceae bacterium]|nr:MFS transporter [Actinomycetaceae bacterium]